MATTKENVKAKVKILLDDIRPHIENKLEKLLDCDLIDFQQQTDDWSLPKDIIVCMAKEIEYEYKAPHPNRGYKKRLDKIFRAIVLGYSYEKI